ncbi:MAG: hypothetical protein ABR905_18430 [Terracidiphilus sp.]|jgi:predicted XRE-type DNA-binding protein
MKNLEYEGFASIWDAIADTLEEPANLRLRSELMDKIEDLIKESGWTQASQRSTAE